MAWTNSASRVAVPMHNTKAPVASGSSVPVWPMRVPRGNQRWTRSTTEREVIPEGLSMTKRPGSDRVFMVRVQASLGTTDWVQYNALVGAVQPGQHELTA